MPEGMDGDDGVAVDLGLEGPPVRGVEVADDRGYAVSQSPSATPAVL